MKLELKLTGRGWFSAHISNQEFDFILELSYLSDGLGDFIRAVRQIAEGIPETSCCWQDEPGEYRWIFINNNDMLSVKIIKFDDTYSKQPVENGKLIYKSIEEKKSFCTEVWQQYTLLKEKNDLKSYKDIWGYDYPIDDYLQLSGALR